MRLLAYGYTAFAGGRHSAAISAVGGTGMIPVALKDQGVALVAMQAG